MNGVERSYWVIPGKLLAGPYPSCPDPGLAHEKLKNLLHCGIRHLIDLTEAQEVDLYGGGCLRYGELLAGLASELGVEVEHTRISISDMSTPSTRRMRLILEAIDASLARDRPVYLHCWGGIGRTGTVVGCFLVRRGLSGEEALERIRELRRGLPAEQEPSPSTEEQRELVRTWADHDPPGSSSAPTSPASG